MITLLLLLVLVPVLCIGISYVRAINRASDALCRRIAEQLIAESQRRRHDD